VTDVVMYSSGWCPYCARARALFERKSIAFREIDIETDAELRAQMIARSGRRSVPQIFIGERHVGGFEELYELERNGELDTLMQTEKT
jgi:glutaredoxin 3